MQGFYETDNVAETMNNDKRPSSTSLTRRDFIAGATVTAAGLAAKAAVPATATAPAKQEGRLYKTAVLQAESVNVVQQKIVHPHLLREMLDWGLMRLTQADSVSDSWRKLLGKAKVVGIKFNRSGMAELGTTPPVADAMIESLERAGWTRDRIVAIEVPSAIYGSLRVVKPKESWLEQEVDFGSGKDRLSAVLEQVDALVNVPFLKTHNIAGMTCSLKNLSHALIKHPAKYHSNRCSPYIADIVSLPQIRNKLKITIVNALITVFEGGPDVKSNYTDQTGTLLFGTDPVAVDVVGLDVLNWVRKRRRLNRIDMLRGDVPYLEAAGKNGLGCVDYFDIDLVRRRF